MSLTPPVRDAPNYTDTDSSVKSSRSALRNRQYQLKVYSKMPEFIAAERQRPEQLLPATLAPLLTHPITTLTLP